MPETRIPFDPLNPGHFFACCGLLERCNWAWTSSLAWFATDDASPRHAEFVLQTPSEFDLQAVLAELRGAPWEAQEHRQKAVQPVGTVLGGRELSLDWWLDAFGEETTPLKCWAGQVTSGKLFADLPVLIDPATPAGKLFFAPVLTRSKLGIDPRSAWNALDFGFSPDKHNRDSATYPAVEVLGALGLQAFRPPALRRGGIAYHLWGAPLPAAVARLAAFAPWTGLPVSRYEFSIGKRGQSYKFFTFSTFIERT